MGGTRVITDTGNDNDCATGCAVNSLQTYVTRNGGFGGVNGTYFCPITYPECSAKTNSYDFPVYNTRLGHWINSGNLFWNSRAMMYFDGGGAHYVQDAKSFGGSLTAGIVNYPGLVNDGQVQIDDNQSGLDPKQVAKGTKVGIGVRGTTIMVVVAQNVNMQEFAYVFKSLGATGALNLDTGGSTALYYGGRYVYGPGRDIPNAIIFASK
jgi:exopolysaccharide biosynthesis protein